MGYFDIETSEHLVPVELYEFEYDTQLLQLTSSKNTFNTETGQTYFPQLIRRSGITRSSRAERSALKLEVPSDFEVAQLFRVGLPSFDIKVTVKRSHVGAGETIVLFNGYVVGCDFDHHKATLTVEPLLGLLGDNTLHRTFKKECNHTVYDSACGLNIEAHTFTAEVQEITENNTVISYYIDAATHAEKARFPAANDFFTNGVAIFNRRKQHIIEHEVLSADSTAFTGSIRLVASFENVAVGDTIELIMGCNRQLSTCQSFNNHLNFGGFPYLPTKDIFQSGI